jgi:hypothetical protein
LGAIQGGAAEEERGGAAGGEVLFAVEAIAADMGVSAYIFLLSYICVISKDGNREGSRYERMRRL